MSARGARVRQTSIVAASLVLATLAGSAHAQGPITCSGVTPEGVTVGVRIDSPASGDLIEGHSPCEDRVVVEGVAATQGRQPPFDLILILDASGSTRAPSGADIDADGETGVATPEGSSDPGDSLLAAEVLAAKRLLGELEGLDVRAAVIDFSAVLSDPSLGEQGRLRLVQELTPDLDAARSALDDVLASGSAGATDYAGPLLLARDEWLARGESERSAVALFLTDGKPTFPRYPYDSTQVQDVVAAREAAAECAAAGLQVDTLALGDFDDIGILGDIATITGGRERGSVSAVDLYDELIELDLSGIETVVVVNDSTGEAVNAELAPDGSFSAEIALAPDFNAIRVIVVPEGGEAYELECAVSISYSCFEELDLCFRATTAEILAEILADSAELAEEIGELTPCQALALEDEDSDCAAGLRELTALIVNRLDGRLTSRCRLDPVLLAPDPPADIDEAETRMRELVSSGTAADCAEAARIGALINSGEALFVGEPPAPEPIECLVEDPETGDTLLITILTPVSGEARPLTEPCDAIVEVEGELEIEGIRNLFDLFFVIDSSGSTSAASGRDIDEDGFLGTGRAYNNTDPGDSVLEAELEAVRTFVAELNPSWARVAIIEFAAILPVSDGRMRIVQSLTRNFNAVESALQDISARGSSGATDYGGAIRLLNEEFLANADPDNRIPICFFLSDGIPTFPDPPYDETQPRDRETAIEATLESASHGIEINTYEVGPAGAADILTEMADLTGGEFYPALVAGDIIDVLNDFELAVIESIVILNETTGEEAEGTVEPDGSFVGSITLQAGENELTITVSTGGTNPLEGTCETDVELIYANLACRPRPAQAWATSCLVLAQPEPTITSIGKDATREGIQVVFSSAPGAAAHRAFRGDLDLLSLRYTHRTPFSSLPGAPECELAGVDGSFLDPGALTDGRNWYYIIATIGPDGLGGFGAMDIDGDGRPDFARPGPEADPDDLVIDECP